MNLESNHVLDGKLIHSAIATPMLVCSQKWVSMLYFTQGLTTKTRVYVWLIKLWSMFGDLCFQLLVKVLKYLLILFMTIIMPQKDMILTLCLMMIRLLTMRCLIHTMHLKNHLHYLIILLNKKLTTNHQLIYSGWWVLTLDSRMHIKTFYLVTHWSITLTPMKEKMQTLN